MTKILLDFIKSTKKDPIRLYFKPLTQKVVNRGFISTIISLVWLLKIIIIFYHLTMIRILNYQKMAISMQQTAQCLKYFKVPVYF